MPKVRAKSAMFGWLRRSWLSLIGGLVCVPMVVFTYLGTCQAAKPNNIIIFMADDLDWNDLPYFSPPLDEAAYGDLKAAYASGDILARRGELTLVSPEANRFAARTFADASGPSAPFAPSLVTGASSPTRCAPLTAWRPTQLPTKQAAAVFAPISVRSVPSVRTVPTAAIPLPRPAASPRPTRLPALAALHA